MVSKILLILAAISFSSTAAAASGATQTALSDSEVEIVPGVNGNVTFCTVPRSEQLFYINFLDIAPLPIPIDQIFFTWLQGYIPSRVTGLENATLSITMSAKLASGEEIELSTFDGVPLTTIAIDGYFHLTVRYPGGKFGGPLKTRMVDVLTDYWIPGAWLGLEAGNYTFIIEGTIPGEEEGDKDRYLFALKMVQWIEPLRGVSWCSEGSVS